MSVFLIFSDDWGRHPSSCQHLTRRLMLEGDHRVYWVNTIGTRPPGLNLLTLRRGFGKIRSWIWDHGKTDPPTREEADSNEAASRNEPTPKILQPIMYPWFRHGFDRRLNRHLMSRAINRVLEEAGETDVTAITTLPIVADLPGELPAVKRWVYYCVDDWSRWPGMDARPLAEMEAELIRKVDRIVTAGENLRDRIQSMGRDSLLLTHGIDLDFWQGAQSGDARQNPEFTRDLRRPVFTFWGLIDERLEPEMVERLAQDVPQSTILLAGPVAAPEVAKRLETIPSARLLGMVPYEKLPQLAAESDVLIMPYRKNEATEQIQPLKMTEYLASGRPAVVRALRASDPWRDALDEADSPETFSRLARFRALSGLPETQINARKRLENETWAEKARQFEAYILENSGEGESTEESPETSQTENEIKSRKMINEIVPITSEKRKTEHKATVLETRVVTGQGGGPEKTILNTPRYMTSYGFPTICAYMRPPKDPGFKTIEKRAAELNCPLIGIDDSGAFDRSVARNLLQICEEKNITIWHGHDYKSNYIGLKLRKKHPMKLVTTVHGWVHHTWKTPFYYLLDRWCLRRYDHVICVSNDLYEQCLAMGVPESRCSLIVNAIDTMQYRRTMKLDEAKTKLGFPTHRIVIGACGRLSPEKNFAGLIRVVAELLKENAPISLFIAGDGPIRDSLQRQINATGFAEHIHLLGFREDIMDFYQGLDVFVLNSLREGLPNVVLEAMAYEVPVISTRVAGVPRLITNGYDGVLIDIKNEVELKLRLAKLIEDFDYRRLLGENGNYTIKAQYSFGVRMKKIRDIYEKILAEK